MKKKDVINEIKTIICNYGGFGTGEVQADCSPTLNTKGNLVHLVDTFAKEEVLVGVYDGKGIEHDAYYLKYEELTLSVLKDILTLARQYKEEQE